MPSFCVVSNCELKYAQAENVSFHRFPMSNPALLQHWVKFTDRGPDWKPSRWSSICSRHFTESDFREYLSRKCLKKQAIPTIQVKSNISYESYYITMNVNDNVQITRSEPDVIEDFNQTQDKHSAFHVYCGLCGTMVDHLLYNAFGSLDDCEINTMYRKCLPTIKILGDGDSSRIICRDCITQLQQYSKFVDRVLAYQRNIDIQFDGDDLQMLDENPQKSIITSDTSLAIKQEPINVKQEKIDNSNKRQFKEKPKSFLTIRKDGGIVETNESNTNQIVENQLLKEPRSSYNPCEIMEVITINNPVIDLAEDENSSNLKLNSPLKIEANKSFLDSSNEIEHIESDHCYAAKLITYRLKQEAIEENESSDTESVDENNISNETHLESFDFEKCTKVLKSRQSLTSPSTKSNRICTVCSAEFNSTYEYLKHKAKEHPSRLQCRKCFRKLKTQKLLTNHERLCKKALNDLSLKCRYCQQRILNMSQMNKHLQQCTRRVSGTVNSTENISIGSQDGQHDVEIDEFENKLHAMDDTNEKIIVSSDSLSNIKSFELKGTNPAESGLKQSFKVVVENSRFIYVNEDNEQLDSELINTIASHPATTEKFGCELCGKPFSSFYALKRHKKTHDAERKFACSLCTKTFKGMSGIKQHISSYHYKIKPHTCQVCNHSYALKGDLQRCRHSRLKQHLLGENQNIYK